MHISSFLGEINRQIWNAVLVGLIGKRQTRHLGQSLPSRILAELGRGRKEPTIALGLLSIRRVTRKVGQWTKCSR
jgi:hypothetical protein